MSKYIIIGLIFLFPLKIMAAVHPSVPELMHRYAQTQDEFQPSFISKMETKGVCTYNFPDRKVHANNVDRYSTMEYRWDGSRMKIITKSWGWMNSSRTREENNKAYNSWLFDGNKFYTYGNGTVNDQFVEGYPGKGGLRGESEKKHSAQLAREMTHVDPFSGYFWAKKLVRVDERILHDKDAYVHNEMQKVGEFQCYVVTAKPENGVQFKVWIDPEHGYNIAKFECSFGEGYDPIGPGRVYEKESNTYLAGTIRSFKMIDGTWVPMEMDYRESLKYPGNHIQKRRMSYKRTEFLINPDHDALGSFLPDDIPNGALIFAHGTRYTWQDGELIPNIDKVSIDMLDKVAEEIMVDKTGSDTNAPSELEKKTEIAALTVAELLNRYRATQESIGFFIAKSQSTIEKNNRNQETTSEFRFDGNRVNHRSTFRDGLLTTKEKPGYKSFLWDGKSFIEYRQARKQNNSWVFIKKTDLSKKRLVAMEYKGAALMGICSGDYERIDSVLGKADTISLQDKPDKIGESECYVIDAATKRGKYTVWIDPEHGYNIAKVNIQRSQGDLVNNTLPLKTSMSFSLDNVRFEQIDAVWVPMEADMEQTEDNGTKITKWHHKRTEMVLNPDFEALKAFVPDDIPDGVKVLFPGVHDRTEYKWQNGKPVTEADNNVKP